MCFVTYKITGVLLAWKSLRKTHYLFSLMRNGHVVPKFDAADSGFLECLVIITKPCNHPL